MGQPLVLLAHLATLSTLRHFPWAAVSSLCGGDDESEMGGPEEEEEEDSFICADGYLSGEATCSDPALLPCPGMLAAGADARAHC